MNAKWTCKILALTAAGLFGLAGCGGSSGGEETGTLSIGLTDGPVDNAEAIYIQFTGLELKPAGGPPDDPYPIDPDSCDESDSAGNCIIDLMQLQGTEYRTLFAKDLPAGDYQWVRLLVNAEQNVNDSYITLKNEDGSFMDCPLWIPSGGETGLKIVSGMTVTANGVSKYMLDFDARTSVTAPPGLPSPTAECLQNYVLKPAIRIVDETEVGSIAGTVTSDLLDGCRTDSDGVVDPLAVYVFEAFDADGDAIEVTADDYDGDGDPITSAMVESNDMGETYEYEVGYLLEGDYKLGLTCTADVDVMPNDDGLIADNFACDFADPDTCEETDPPFVFIGEQDATVVVDMLEESHF